MNLEPPTNLSAVDAAPVNEALLPVPQTEFATDESDAAELDAVDSEAQGEALSKFATLMLDMPSQAPDKSVKLSVETNLKYVQGVVYGQQAYLITNLLRGESQTLFQPQMVWTIGRNREAALPLQERDLSRRHAVILYTSGEGFQLIDLNSMNGSFVNGSRVQQRCLLKDGDRLRLGSTDFTFLFSRSYRTLDSIHPEILARFNAKLQAEDLSDVDL
ncbi:MAG TPA: FHA domain-containing protein [Thermosynechococcaceae cyanobacterium]